MPEQSAKSKDCPTFELCPFCFFCSVFPVKESTMSSLNPIANFFFFFFVILRLLSRLISPFVVDKIPRLKGSGFWIPVIQVFASFNLLLATVVIFCWSTPFWFILETSSTESWVPLIVVMSEVSRVLCSYPSISWNSIRGIGGSLAMCGQVINSFCYYQILWNYLCSLSFPFYIFFLLKYWCILCFQSGLMVH